jgi:hypothetical protein
LIGSLVAAAALTAVLGGSAPQVLFRIADPRIDEASGIAVGIASPGVVYVQNDSGDSARFFALDARTGRTVATYEVPGAANVDWEDIAVARDRRAVPSVWLADICDNRSDRDEIRVYRVDEPRPGATTTAPPEIWRLRYPGGPVDAESLAVAPGGAACVLTKSIFGATDVYALPSRADPNRVHVLRRIGGIDFRPTGTPGGPNVVGQLTATGAALSRDGSLLAVRTYTDAYVWQVRGGDVARALLARPARVALPPQPQGEGIAIDGARLLIDSEHAGSDVFAVPLPHPVTPAPRRRATGPTGSPARTAARSFPWAVLFGAIAGVLGLAVVLGRRSRRRHRT